MQDAGRRTQDAGRRTQDAGRRFPCLLPPGPNHPTLTSNSTTLGWGTLEIPAGIRDSAHSKL